MEKINQLLICINPVVQLAIPFLVDEKKDITEAYREQMMVALANFERNAAAKVALMQIEQAKYALAAFIDEIVLSSTWEGKDSWMGKPLQLEFFGEHLAGEGFFKKLNELRQNAEQNIDVLEIYFFCLQLGFEGKYRWCGVEKLQALQVDLRRQIELIRGDIDSCLISEISANPILTKQLKDYFPYWLITAVTIAVIFFIYLGSTWIIDRQAYQVLARINVSKNIFLQELTQAAFKLPTIPIILREE